MLKPLPIRSSFSGQLAESTVREREFLLSSPLIDEALTGRITGVRYLAFLAEAYHHVRHTVPLLMAVGSRLPAQHQWLQREILHYLGEEAGHEQWILNDIRAAGGNAESVMTTPPNLATAAMVSFAYDTVMRRNPVGFFGMVHVLEGTSVAVACRAADSIERTLGLPPRALTYLRSHGELDQEHVQHLAGILDRLDDPADQAAVIDCARGIYWLYGCMFRSLEPGELAA
jgi:pyrroloquinoline quinone (PQQ) biosynthesis protein C